MGKRNYIKLDSDDIMEILLEYYQERFEFSENAKGIFLGEPNSELRFIAVFGETNDEEIQSIDLEKVDQEIEYNGEHAFLKKNPEFYLD